jgi:hypothetical protein
MTPLAVSQPHTLMKPKQAKNGNARSRKTKPAPPKKTKARKRQESDDDEESSDHLSRRKRSKRHAAEEISDDEPDEPEVEVIDSSEEEVSIRMLLIEFRGSHSIFKGSDLEEWHQSNIPTKLKVKGESTKDLLLIFSERVTVKFKKKNDNYETVVGRWCNVCR